MSTISIRTTTAKMIGEIVAKTNKSKSQIVHEAVRLLLAVTRIEELSNELAKTLDTPYIQTLLERKQITTAITEVKSSIYRHYYELLSISQTPDFTDLVRTALLLTHPTYPRIALKDIIRAILYCDLLLRMLSRYLP